MRLPASKETLSAFLLFLITGFLLYFNTFNAPFIFDDYPNIVNNLRIHDISNFIPPSGRRDAGYLTFALNYKFSLLSVTPYHVVNTLIHIANSMLVYILLVLFLKNVSPEGDGRKNRLIAASAGLIFLVHPVQTGAVTYIVQRFTSLAALFYLASVVFYIKASAHYSRNRTFFSGAHLPYYVMSILSAVIAMKTKEITVTLPLMLFICEMFMKKAQAADNSRSKPVLYFFPFVIIFFIIPAVLISADVPTGDLIGEIGSRTAETRTIGRAEYLFTQFRVVAHYLRLFFVPVGQNLDYDYKISTAIFDPATLLALSLHIIIIAFAFMIYFKGSKGAVLAIPFGIFWFYITLSVESGIIPIRDVIFEHRMYLPSAGLAGAVIAGLVISAERISREKAVPAIIALTAVAALLLSAMTVQRNRLWQDGIGIWRDAVRKSPLKPRPHTNLANKYKDKGRYEEAIMEYKKALALGSTMPGIHNNLGNIYKRLGRYDDAMNEYLKDIRQHPDFAEGYYNLGVLLYEKSEWDSALLNLRKAIGLSPSLFEAHITIGNIYDDTGRPDEALKEYAKALRINPDSHLAYFNRGVFYERTGDIKKAVQDYRKSLQLNPAKSELRIKLQRMGY